MISSIVFYQGNSLVGKSKYHKKQPEVLLRRQEITVSMDITNDFLFQPDRKQLTA